MEASVSEQDMPQNEEQNAGATSYELSADEKSQLAALEENLAKFEGLKRWSDVIKTLIAKADLFKDPELKVEHY